MDHGFLFLFPGCAERNLAVKYAKIQSDGPNFKQIHFMPLSSIWLIIFLFIL